jgi:cytochrome bd-type quinol oxidase subunit 1
VFSLLLFFIAWLCDLAEYYGELRWLLYFAFFAVVLALLYSYAGAIVRWIRRIFE